MDKLYKFKGNYDHRSTDTNPTLYRDMIDYLDNQNKVLAETVNAFLWQPDTDYIVGTKVITKAMPKGCIAECIAKGTSGKEEPTWVKGVVNDNGIEWKVYNPTEYDIKPTANSDKPVTSNGVYNAIDTAVSDAHHYIKRSATYAKGDVLTSPELQYDAIIEVTQAGTSGTDEPDWSTIKDDLGKATDEENSAIATLQKTIDALQTKVETLNKASAYHAGDVIDVGNMYVDGHMTGGTKDAQFFVCLPKPIASDVTTVRMYGNFRLRQNGKYISDYNTTYGFDTSNGTDKVMFFNELGFGIDLKMAGSVEFPNMTNNDCIAGDFMNIKIEFK